MGHEDRLRAAGDWLGASCVARWRDAGFLFAARVDGARLVLSGIGGKVEPGETFRAAMLREYREETGTEAGRIVEPPPRHLDEGARRQPVPESAAALISERPAGHPTGGTLWIAVFLAVAADAPRPVEKVGAFAVVPSHLDAVAGPTGLDVADIALLVDGALVPAPSRISTVEAEHTARAVLGHPGLLLEWWAATT
jgi:8-oxo-dGTP pyrophosphatase MutT (NUDIX family)